MFLDDNKGISPENIGDLLHATAKGHQLLAEAIEPQVAKLFQI